MASKIAVIGGGAWGSAIASCLSGNGKDVRILTRRQGLAESLAQGISPNIDGVAIVPPRLASTDPKQVMDGVEAVFIAVPAAATEDTLNQLAQYLPADIPIAFAAKGLVPSSGALIIDFARAKLTNSLVVFSGPSFADEVVMGKPTALVSASNDAAAAQQIAALFETTNIRVYTSDDPVGVAVGGTVKNVIAIASGIVQGLDLGDNARAALMTRGLAEATRLALVLGGSENTLFGLAGLGDMALTCSGTHSRNFAYGLALGRGTTPDSKLAEGRHSCEVIARRSALAGVDMPITQAVARVVSGEGDIMDEITQLMARPANNE